MTQTGSTTTITLTDEQAAIVREVLDGVLRELRYEIADTDGSEWKQRLKAREESLRALLVPLGGPLPDPPPPT
jgi:hypothetical protein